MSIIRKIAILCLFLCCSYIIAEKAQAEIHWTAISNGNPKNIQELDIDGDGVTDLTLSIIDNVAIFDGEDFIIKMAKVFDSPNLKIMSCQPGNKGVLCGYLTDNGQTNGWWNNGPKYLGFKRILNDGIYYGWLKVELTNEGWQIFEYAYEDCPTVVILSGAKQGGANCPAVTAITRTKASPTRLNEINFSVKFSHNVTAIDLMDFALTTTYQINGASIISLAGNNDTYIVSVNTGTGDGTIRLDLINNHSIKSTNNLPLKASFTDGETYKIDKTPPNTTIYSKPLNPSSKKNPAHFIFSGNDILSYECQLDSGNFEKCISPIYIKSLNEGSHTFKVRAIDEAGNIDPTPASYTWIINNDDKLSDITITTEAVIIGGIITGNIKNEGVIKDVHLGANAHVDGGKVSGKITSDKKAPALLTNVILTQDVKLAADVSLHNVELRGASITGNHLSGNIRVTSSETVIKNVSLGANTTITGGKLAGKITTDKKAPALLTNVILTQDVKLAANVSLHNVELRGASINGNHLSGDIKVTSSATVIKNVSLGANTTITGGKLTGRIRGDKQSPAVLEHLIIEPNSHLTDVIIADGVDLPKQVNLGLGVRFSSKENIPEGLDLTSILPKLNTGVDLSIDVVVGGKGILAAINRLPEFTASNLTVKQSKTGYLYLDIEDKRYAVNPTVVKHLSDSPNLLLEIGQNIRFKTDTEIDVFAPPAIQAPEALQMALSEFKIDIDNIGTIHVKAKDKKPEWFSARANLFSIEIENDTKTGLSVKENNVVVLVFIDQDGKKREQNFYPAPYDLTTLVQVAQEVDLTTEGILSFKLEAISYEGKLDYLVKQGTVPKNKALKVEAITDSNYLITYPNGAKQILWQILSN